MTFFLMFSCFVNNCQKSRKKKLNICEIPKINHNSLNFLTPLHVCICAHTRMCVCGTNIVVCILYS